MLDFDYSSHNNQLFKKPYITLPIRKSYEHLYHSDHNSDGGDQLNYSDDSSESTTIATITRDDDDQCFTRNGRSRMLRKMTDIRHPIGYHGFNIAEEDNLRRSKKSASNSQFCSKSNNPLNQSSQTAPGFNPISTSDWRQGRKLIRKHLGPEKRSTVPKHDNLEDKKDMGESIEPDLEFEKVVSGTEKQLVDADVGDNDKQCASKRKRVRGPDAQPTSFWTQKNLQKRLKECQKNAQKAQDSSPERSHLQTSQQQVDFTGHQNRKRSDKKNEKAIQQFMRNQREERRKAKRERVQLEEAEKTKRKENLARLRELQKQQNKEKSQLWEKEKDAREKQEDHQRSSTDVVVGESINYDASSAWQKDRSDDSTETDDVDDKDVQQNSNEEIDTIAFFESKLDDRIIYKTEELNQLRLDNIAKYANNLCQKLTAIKHDAESTENEKINIQEELHPSNIEPTELTPFDFDIIVNQSAVPLPVITEVTPELADDKKKIRRSVIFEDEVLPGYSTSNAHVKTTIQKDQLESNLTGLIYHAGETQRKPLISALSPPSRIKLDQILLNPVHHMIPHQNHLHSEKCSNPSKSSTIPDWMQNDKHKDQMRFMIVHKKTTKIKCLEKSEKRKSKEKKSFHFSKEKSTQSTHAPSTSPLRQSNQVEYEDDFEPSDQMIKPISINSLRNKDEEVVVSDSQEIEDNPDIEGRSAEDYNNFKKSENSLEENSISEVDESMKNTENIEQVSQFSVSTRATSGKKSKKAKVKRVGDKRLSPASLERQFLIELHYNDSLAATVEQLLETQRLHDTAVAQQETVSLAQLLKAKEINQRRELEVALIEAAQQQLNETKQAVNESNEKVKKAADIYAKKNAELLANQLSATIANTISAKKTLNIHSSTSSDMDSKKPPLKHKSSPKLSLKKSQSDDSDKTLSIATSISDQINDERKSELNSKDEISTDMEEADVKAKLSKKSDHSDSHSNSMSSVKTDKSHSGSSSNSSSSANSKTHTRSERRRGDSKKSSHTDNDAGDDGSLVYTATSQIDSKLDESLIQKDLNDLKKRKDLAKKSIEHYLQKEQKKLDNYEKFLEKLQTKQKKSKKPDKQSPTRHKTAHKLKKQKSEVEKKETSTRKSDSQKKQNHLPKKSSVARGSFQEIDEISTSSALTTANVNKTAETMASARSIPESIATATTAKTPRKSSAVTSKSIDEEVASARSYEDSFVSSGSNKTTTASHSSKSTKPMRIERAPTLPDLTSGSDHSQAARSNSSSEASQKGTAPSSSSSVTSSTTITELDEIEARISGLKKMLEKKRAHVDALKHNRKQKRRERLAMRERTLEKQIKMEEANIEKLEKDIDQLDKSLEAKGGGSSANATSNNTSNTTSSICDLKSMSIKETGNANEAVKSEPGLEEENDMTSSSDTLTPIQTQTNAETTPRTPRIIQFSEINEEYSHHSDPDSSRSKSKQHEKHDNDVEKATKKPQKSKSKSSSTSTSKSEKRIVEEKMELNSDIKKQDHDNDIDEQNERQKALEVPMSARTIHSAMSDIPEDLVVEDDSESTDSIQRIKQISESEKMTENDKEAVITPPKSPLKDYSDSFISTGRQQSSTSGEPVIPARPVLPVRDKDSVSSITEEELPSSTEKSKFPLKSEPDQVKPHRSSVLGDDTTTKSEYSYEPSQTENQVKSPTFPPPRPTTSPGRKTEHFSKVAKSEDFADKFVQKFCSELIDEEIAMFLQNFCLAEGDLEITATVIKSEKLANSDLKNDRSDDLDELEQALANSTANFGSGIQTTPPPPPPTRVSWKATNEALFEDIQNSCLNANLISLVEQQTLAANIMNEGLQAMWNARKTASPGNIEAQMCRVAVEAAQNDQKNVLLLHSDSPTVKPSTVTQALLSTVSDIDEAPIELENMTDAYIERELIFDATCEMIGQVYAGEDDEEIEPWQHPSKQMKSSNFKLWQKMRRPQTFELLKNIVQSNMASNLGIPDENPVKNRKISPATSSLLLQPKSSESYSQVTKWSLSKKKDPVDKVLVEELKSDDWKWSVYDSAEFEVTIKIADSIFDEEISKIIDFIYGFNPNEQKDENGD